MDKSLKELVSTDRRFQSSVNLMLDINDENKIEGYIPTRSSLGVLNKYLSDIACSDYGNATVLIGPYGKGKSHLILVWLSLLSGKKSEIKEKLISKIREVDSATGKLAEYVYQNDKKFLPVLLSNTDMSLNQAFLISLYESLQKAGLSNVVPDSYYSEAVKTINIWNKRFPGTYKQLEEKLYNKSKTINEFIESLKDYDKESLNFFRSIYPDLTAGNRFEPILQQDSLKVYQSISKELKENYGFDGLILVFDEFSKYIEGHGKESFASDMRVLQEMCELSAGSRDASGKIQLVLIAHKSIKEYGTRLSSTVRKEYEGVEGRLNERLFVISSQNNYELIKNTINKTSEVENIFESKIFKDICSKNAKLQAFRGLFDNDNDFVNIIAKGCFPLLPLSTYLLLGISERVAQNERTIFTFLCYDEYGSLTNIIDKHKKGESLFVASDAVYDYFAILFKENVTDAFIHNEWLKADYALSIAESADEKKVIKAIALIQMIGKPEELLSDENTIKLATGVLEDNIRQVLENLEKKQLIVYRKRTSQYVFRHNVGIDLDKEIRNRIAGLQNKYSISEVIAEIAEMDYLLPRRHNQTFKMTRFFKYIYLTEDEFLSIPSFDVILSGNNFADGCIICVLFQNYDKKDACLKKMKSSTDFRVVMVMPKDSIEIENLIQKYVVVKRLLSSNDFLLQHQVLKQELLLLQEDVVYEINESLEKVTSLKDDKSIIYHAGSIVTDLSSIHDFNEFLSRICDEYYNDTPIINHELVNIRKVTGQYLKARNAVITSLLNGESLDKFVSGTSPEAMVFRSSLLYTGIYRTKDNYVLNPGTKAVINVIQDFFRKSVGEKVSFSCLIKTLLGKGYGMRKGVIPIYLSSQLVALSNMPVIYLMDKEVDVSAEIINNLCEKPED